MINIPGVDLRAVIEKVSGDLGGCGKVQRRLSIAPGSMHQFRIRTDEFLELIDHSQAGRRVGSDPRATFDGIDRQFGCGTIEQPEASGPPAAAGVDVGARCKKNIQHLAASNLNNRRRIKISDGLVDLCLQCRKAFEQSAHGRRVVIAEGRTDERNRVFGL